MLRQVVLTGTGRRAQLNGYTSAGKTGTAWKFNPATKRVDPSKYISSFIGFAPAEDPDIVIAVVMDEPQVGARDGGTVSAPVFREIAESVLPELNINPDANVAQQAPAGEDIPETAAGGNGPSAPLDLTKTDEANTSTSAADSAKPSAAKPGSQKSPRPTKKQDEPAPSKRPAAIKNKTAALTGPDEKRNKASAERTRQKT
jgi:cell division protein FtsI (penicillin-binding protein 3)